MQEPTHYSQAALSYARALLELGEEQKLPAESIAQELDALSDLIGSDDTFRQYLADPSISAEQRWALLKRVLAGRISPIVLQFLGVLSEKGRLALVREIVDAYNDLLDQKLGKVEVDVIVSQKLTADELQEVKTRVSQALKRDAVVHPYVDDSIIGGMILRIGDQLIDASVKNQLHEMKEKLLASRPN